ncbi:hypothetical protein HDU98_002355 [Podochytrium sp. JEL0797]|nr:hypothetical protein HDU98_002355 [Podochytrium sp. JEL0797]
MPPPGTQRVQRVLPRNAERILLLLIVVCIVVGIQFRWSADLSPREQHVRNLPVRGTANHTSPVPLRGVYFKDEDTLRKVVDSAVKDALQNHTAFAVAKQPTAESRPDPPPLSLDVLDQQIDLLQVQWLDFLNGEEGMLPNDASLSGGSLQKLATPFDLRGTWSKLHQYALQVKAMDYNRTDFLLLGRRVRALHIAYTVLHDKPSLIPVVVGKENPSISNINDLYRELQSIVDDSTRLLYPWLQPTFSSLREMQQHFLKTSEDGIVVCSGKWHFEMAIHLITTLRQVLNSTLPVEVFYGGPEDLPDHMLASFNALPFVKTVNLLDYFPTETKLWGGWSMKPFATLASRFRRVIFVDADALFFQDPRVLLDESALFRQFGQVFYHDRTLGGNDPWWFKEINPVWSRYSERLRYMQKDSPRSSQHEMESGVVVMDKGRTGVLHALMTVCKMNSKLERDGITYHRVYGDKETYWISWDLVRTPYRFTPSYGGTVGYKNEKGHVCGGLFHTDENLQPLWWNGGVMANKHASKDSLFMKFEFAAYDTHAEDIEWEWETETTPFCLGPQNPAKEVLELNPKQKWIGARFVELYQDIKKKSGVST